MKHTEDQLNRGLTDGAGLFEARGGRERTLEEVLGTARTIRRRRRAGVALVAAAVAAAVAVPIGLTLGSPQATVPPPASTGTPTPTPAPRRVDRIGLGDLPVGAAPGTGWVQGRTWHAADRKVTRIALPPTYPSEGHVVGVARLGSALLASVSSSPWAEAVLFKPGADPVPLGPVNGAIASSPDGSIAAFVAPSGRSVTTVQDDGHTVGSIPGPTPVSQTLQAAAVTGEDCRATGTGCAVWLNDAGSRPRLWMAVAAYGDSVVHRMQTLADIATDGHKAGIVSRTDSGTCSEVQDGSSHKLWGTCTARFTAFSPDGSRLLGTSAYGDGLGDAELAVFDAGSGRSQLQLRTTRGAVITQMAWEDDSHVLAVVLQGQRAAIVRIGVDGRAEYAVPPVPSAPDVSPFVLPAS